MNEENLEYATEQEKKALQFTHPEVAWAQDRIREIIRDRASDGGLFQDNLSDSVSQSLCNFVRGLMEINDRAAVVKVYGEGFTNAELRAEIERLAGAEDVNGADRDQSGLLTSTKRSTIVKTKNAGKKSPANQTKQGVDVDELQKAMHVMSAVVYGVGMLCSQYMDESQYVGLQWQFDKLEEILKPIL
jgi:hypothetical protein